MAQPDVDDEKSTVGQHMMDVDREYESRDESLGYMSAPYLLVPYFRGEGIPSGRGLFHGWCGRDCSLW